MKKAGTIRDVARETGLSTATVSRVVNGSSNVSAPTRERVLNACRKLDYVPNPAARALSTRRSRTVAAIIPTIEHSVFAKYIAAIEQALDEHNYSLVLAIADSDSAGEVRAARKLLGMGADAFILSGAEHDAELLGLLDRRRVPYIFASVWNPAIATPTVGYDNHDLAKMAFEFLTENGHRSIAVLHGPLENNDRATARRAGVESATRANTVTRFFQSKLNVSDAKRAAHLILKADESFTAVLCFSDVLAEGVYFACQTAGVRIPQDLSVMGFDNLDWSAEIVPPLTTINLPARRMGREVASQLVDYLEEARPLRPKFLTGKIIQRGSVATIDSKKA